MKKIVFILGLAISFFMPPHVSWAQLEPPNEAGVTLGQVYLNVRDVEVSRKFFLRVGGTPIRLGSTEGIRYPGAILFLTKADPVDGTEGSVVDHIGFSMKEGAAFFAKLAAEGVKSVSSGPNAKGQAYGGYIYSPDGVKIEITDSDIVNSGAPWSLAGPLHLDEIHFFLADPGPQGGPAWSELQNWYTTVFGAKVTIATLLRKPTPGNTAPPMSQSSIGGTNLRFSPVAAAGAPIRGRALDHIGFEVKNLEAFCRRLEAQGVRFDIPYHSKDGIKTATLTDPAGTYIELTEGLDRL